MSTAINVKKINTVKLRKIIATYSKAQLPLTQSSLTKPGHINKHAKCILVFQYSVL